MKTLRFFGVAILLAVVPMAKAVNMTVLNAHVGNTYSYDLYNIQVAAHLAQFSVHIGGYQLGTAAISNNGWSVLSETSFDSNSDGIIDGYWVTFKANDSGTTLAPSDAMNFNFNSSSNVLSNQAINYAFTGGGLSEQVSLPYFQSVRNNNVPDGGSTIMMLGAVLGGLAVAFRTKSKR